MNPRDADPLTLPDVGRELNPRPRPRVGPSPDRRGWRRPRLDRRPRLSPGERAALAGMVFLSTFGLALFVLPMAKAWVFVVACGWGVVLASIWDWARGLDA